MHDILDKYGRREAVEKKATKATLKSTKLIPRASAEHLDTRMKM